MIKFEPLLKQTLWGGSKIIPFKHLDAQLENVGESWEISGVSGNETIVANGQYKGMSLNQLVREMKGSLVGEENYQRFGDEFPLLIKFIDACQDLSIHNGLKQQITPEQYKEMVADDTITDALARYEVKEGDVFFIPAGRIHAIGAGCFVAEIQQTSDVTYRIYDFKRKDKNGNYRELHTQLASESIDYTVLDNYRTDYEPVKNEGTQVVTCPYFTTAVYDLDEPMTLDYSELDSFVILIAVKGGGQLISEGEEMSFQMGDTVLLPATTKEVKVEGTVKFLETYV